MKILGIIPARYASTRFPGKPLAMINGKTMIQRVYEQAKKCSSLENVIVATDDDAIFKHVESFGGNVVMTSESHPSGTDRIAEVVEILNNDGEHYDAIINIQGDEPYIDPKQIELIAQLFEDPDVVLGTLIKQINTIEELNNSNVVKVVKDLNDFAVYFSRYSIPFCRNEKEDEEKLKSHSYYKHIGIYGYKSDVLRQITKLNMSSLEKSESLEQLRWLENGFKIKVAITDIEGHAVDTYDDLLKLVK
ncbi:MAG: 3-deoxy-manno-octulosonate cytidylyltransferase [Hyphomicrobiales bacterium]